MSKTWKIDQEASSSNVASRKPNRVGENKGKLRIVPLNNQLTRGGNLLVKDVVLRHLYFFEYRNIQFTDYLIEIILMKNGSIYVKSKVVTRNR